MMLAKSKSIFLADDDLDDCYLFEEALKEIPTDTHLTIAHDGVELMELLSVVNGELPSLLFLDLNMPRKNGFQCLEEMKRSDKLKYIDVIILSTSFHQDLVDKVVKMGAKNYFQKPGDFNLLKRLLEDVLNPSEEPIMVTCSEGLDKSKFTRSAKT